jgi:hypothetical protein
MDLDWRDLDEELRKFIIALAKEYNISKDRIQMLVELIYLYGFQCFEEGYYYAKEEEDMSS